jgi:hypothetical protein
LAPKKRIAKIKDGLIKLPSDVLDALFLNEGDYIAFIEENGRFYIRRTTQMVDTESTREEDVPPPPTFEEKASSTPPAFNVENMVDAVQSALKDPALMKQLQEIGKQVFGDVTKIFGDLNKTPVPTKHQDPSNADSPKKGDSSKAKRPSHDDHDNDDPDEADGYKIDID